tara:strand:- start:13520 stop:13744 length:225 start_codon:yes stop_codon:yes gene_type:complete
LPFNFIQEQKIHLMENLTLSISGLLILVLIFAMPYYNYHLFLDHILSGSFILGIAYAFKILREGIESTSNKDQA